MRNERSLGVSHLYSSSSSVHVEPMLEGYVVETMGGMFRSIPHLDHVRQPAASHSVSTLTFVTAPSKISR